MQNVMRKETRPKDHCITSFTIFQLAIEVVVCWTCSTIDLSETSLNPSLNVFLVQNILRKAFVFLEEWYWNWKQDSNVKCKKRPLGQVRRMCMFVLPVFVPGSDQEQKSGGSIKQQDSQSQWVSLQITPHTNWGSRSKHKNNCSVLNSDFNMKIPID